jgi:hypothetical protein
MYSTNLSVTPADAKGMLEYFGDKKSQLIKDNPQVFKKLAEYQAMIDKLGAIVNTNTPQYPSGLSWNQRIKYILTLNPKGLTTREVVDAIADQEGIAHAGEEWKSIYKGVAPSLSAGEKLYRKRVNEDGKKVFTLI